MKVIVGHDKEIKELNNIIINDKISHAYLFSGCSGIGKYTIAKEFAKSILCLNSINGEYCGNCKACQLFETNSDFSTIEPDDSNSIKVDPIREFLKEVFIKPTTSNRKVFIINNADMMTESAQNALLKSLEEPPEYATIILIASNKSLLRNTILSRCTKIEFNKLKKEELINLANLNNETIKEEYIDYCGGSFEKLLKISSASYMDIVLRLGDCIQRADLLEFNRVLKELKALKTIKEDINEILNLLIVKIHESNKENSSLMINQISLIEKVRNNINRNANLEDSLDYMMISFYELNQ